MIKSKPNKELEKYISDKLGPIEDLFLSIAIGKYDVDFEIPEEENEFTMLYTGIKLMLDSSREKLNELNKLNSQLKVNSRKRGLLLDQLEQIAHIGSWEWNLNDNFIVCSNEMLKIYGLKAKPRVFDYNFLLNKCHERDINIVTYIIKKAIADHKPFKIHYRIILDSGEIRFLEARGEVETHNEIPIKLFGTVQDITSLKESKEKLILTKQELEAKVNERTRDLKKTYLNLEKEMGLKREAQVREKNLAAIVDSSHEAIFSISPTGEITSWNQGAQNNYGYTENEIIGKHISTIIPENKIDEFRAYLKNINVGEKVGGHNTVRRKKNGTEIQVALTMSPMYDHNRVVIGCSVVERDITNLLNEQKKFEIAVEASPNAMVMVDDKGKIILINSQTEKLFGYDRSELMTKPIDILVPKEIKGKHRQYRNLYIDDPKSRFMGIGRELFGVKKDGSRVSVEIGLNPIETIQGRFVLASIVDITERKKFEQEIKRSEDRYKTLVQTMNEGVLIVDNKDTIVFSNEFMCKTLGYKLDEMLGQNASKLLLDVEGRKKMREVTNLRKKGKSSKYEIQFETKNKEKIWMLISGSPIYDSDGKIIGSVGLHTDITSRKRMEHELNAIANIPEENPNPTFRFSVEEQRVVYSNPASKNTLDFFNNKDKKEVRHGWISVINNVYRTKKSIKKELSVNNRTYMCTIVPVPKNGYVNVYAVDITSTKEAEAEIKKLSLVLSKTENAVFITDKNGIIQWVNEGFKRITGYSIKEVVGTSGENLRRGKKTGLNKDHPYFKKMLTSRQSVSYEAHNYKKNGEGYWSITTLTPVFDDNNELESIIAIDTDITYKKMAEKEIIKAKQLAEDSAKTKELFLANMSHEIRTPMNAIMGIIQLLKDTDLDENQLEYLKSMDFAGENLLRIINDVLDLAKIESGKMSVEAIQFNVERLVQDLVNSFIHRAGEKGLKMSQTIDDAVPRDLIGDPVRLNQILINLISNAIKFTNEGEIKLLVSCTKKTSEAVIVRFIVEDTGIGIPKELHRIIFSDFEQANKETTRKYGGTGLGLSIVKKLLTLQNGNIELVSEEGVGTRFIFEIPYKLGSVSNSIDPYSDNTDYKSQLADKKVLLVEDNSLNQMVATRFLESMGASVTITNNGLEAVIELEQSPDYDMVLMDIQMPEMDGYTATKYIRSKMKGKIRKIPILAMTAHAISGEREKCLDAGMNDYITKPLKRETLMLKIINLLNIAP